MKSCQQTSTGQLRSGGLLLIILALVALASTQWIRASPVQAQGRTGLVLAFYYAWYSPQSFGPGKTAFQPAQPYSSSDAATIQRHVSEARSAGIDGFVQSWYGPAEPVTNGNFLTLLDIASATGFKAAVDFEPATALSSHDERASALQSLLATHANHPAYLRVDGKPVIFFWANWAYSVEDWAYIRSIADPGHNSIWVAEGANTEYLQVFDGLHLYNIAWSANPHGIASTWAANTRAAAESYGAFKYWVATAMPGFDDRHLGRGEASVYRDRASGAYYQNSFASAAASSPDMLIITSFNEWAEGSNIEPSTSFGNTYLELTAQLVSSYKSGGVPPPPPLPEPTAEATTNAVNDDGAAHEDGAEGMALAQGDTGTPPPTVVVSPTPQSDGRIVYEVVAGDTLSAIAFRFDVTLDQLYAWNELDENALLSVGQPIVVGLSEEASEESGVESTSAAVTASASAGPTVHLVEEGDTLLALAIQYDLSMEDLLALNPALTQDSLLQLGQEIVVDEQQGPQSVGGSTDFPESMSTPPVSVTTPVTNASVTPLPTDIPDEPAATPTEALAAVMQPTPSPQSAVDSPVAEATPSAAQRSEAAEPSWLIPVGALVLATGVSGAVLYYLGSVRAKEP